MNIRRRGLTITETAAVVGALALSLSLLLPVLAQARHEGLSTTSRDNLRVLHQAMTCYAEDWNGRQFTAIPDDFGLTGGSCSGYEAQFGFYPPMFAGWSCDGSLFGWGFNCTGNWIMAQPIIFDTDLLAGLFRIPNVRGLHDYVNGKVYDPVYYSPLDTKAYDAVEPFFDVDCELAATEEVNFLVVPSTYCLSPAAMYDPAVLRAPSAGGFRHPADFADGFRSPSVSQAAFPALKTWMIEHNWLRHAPAPCNPAYEDPLGDFTNPATCDPYLFNHGRPARPLTLFFDGSLDRLRTGDVADADEQLIMQTGDGLWARDTPLGETGYFGEASFDGVVVSHHVLTIDGILGRDRLP